MIEVNFKRFVREGLKETLTDLPQRARMDYFRGFLPSWMGDEDFYFPWKVQKLSWFDRIFDWSVGYSTCVYNITCFSFDTCILSDLCDQSHHCHWLSRILIGWSLLPLRWSSSVYNVGGLGNIYVLGRKFDRSPAVYHPGNEQWNFYFLNANGFMIMSHNSNLHFILLGWDEIV